jgi:predicted GNAT family acetyltransferase
MKQIFLKVFNALFSCAKLWCVDLTDGDTLPEKDLSDYSFKVINKNNELEKHKTRIAQERGDEYIDLISRRINNGTYWCYVFIHNESGKYAYTRWTCSNNFYSESMNLNLNLKDDEIFTLNSYTHPQFRKQGLHREMNTKMLNYIRDNTKCSKVYMVIRCFLPHLEKIPRSLGYFPVKRSIYYKRNSLTNIIKRILILK